MKLTYTRLINQTLNLYFQDKLEEAYQYITKNGPLVKGNDAQIYNFRYAIASASGKHELAISLMKEAFIEKEYWVAYDYLMEDEDLEPVREDSTFLEMANLCKQREKEAHQSTLPELKIWKPELTASQNPLSTKLLVALHGNQENIELTEDYWLPCLDDHIELAIPKSSQIEFSMAYSWDDLEIGCRELSNHLQGLQEDQLINSENLILGGFSAGARLALYQTLNTPVSPKGIILVAPWLPELDEWIPQLEILNQKGTKCFIICGNQDEDAYDDAKRLAKQLTKRAIPNVFKVINGLQHEYPDNFEELLHEAIQFIGE